MVVSENADVVKMDSSGQSQDNNNVLEADTKPPCFDDQKIPEPDSSVETSNPTKDQNSDGTLESEISRLDNKFSKLNPMAKEYVPYSLAQPHFGFVGNMVWLDNNIAMMQAIPAVENGHFDPRRRNFDQGKRWTNRKTSLAQNTDEIRRTVYVSDIDQQATEEQLASLFLFCGQVVDCRICGDSKSILRFAFIEFTDEEGARSALSISGTLFGSHPIKVLPSKTAIAPVDPSFLPRSEEERKKCVKTVYCTNIDKEVTQRELRHFFRTACGEIQHLRLLGDYHHQTRIAFIEFTLAESAISALNCSGVVLGGLRVRVSPSKTPVRPHPNDLTRV
ncbi:Polyadenylate-binding protein-interacting protein 13 [Raphanus sativus]|nr:Polyadenylate-binding protein-interacting protein 13 [Raphanus sativus]